MKNNSNQVKISLPANKKIISPSILALGFFLILVFSDNHNALFIADYYYFLFIFVIVSLVEILFLKKGQSSFIVCFLLVSFFALLVGSLLNYQYVDKGTFESYIAWFLVAIVYMTRKFSKREIRFLQSSFVLGGVILALLVIVLKNEYGYPGSNRYSIHFGSNEQIDPNYLASFLFVSLFFSLLKISKSNGYFSIICASVITLGILFTGSRSAFACILILFVGFFISKFKTKKATLFWGSLVVVVVSISIFFTLPEVIRNRFNISGLFDESNRLRLEHWKAALYTYSLNPLLGYGASHTQTLLSVFANHMSDAHNTVLTFLLHFGLIGTLSFSLFVFLIFSKYINRNKKNKILIVFFGLAFFLNNLIIANHLGISFWMPLLFLGTNYSAKSKCSRLR